MPEPITLSWSDFLLAYQATLVYRRGGAADGQVPAVRLEELDAFAEWVS